MQKKSRLKVVRESTLSGLETILPGPQSVSENRKTKTARAGRGKQSGQPWRQFQSTASTPESMMLTLRRLPPGERGEANIQAAFLLAAVEYFQKHGLLSIHPTTDGTRLLISLPRTVWTDKLELKP